jgi:hypothetical protein
MFLLVITLDPQPWSDLSPPVIANLTFPLSGPCPSLFRLDEPCRSPSRYSVRMHSLLQQVERTQRFQRDNQLGTSSPEEAGNGGQRKGECRSVQDESSFCVRVFLRRSYWFPGIRFRCALNTSSTSNIPPTVVPTPVSSSSSPPSPTSTTKCKVARDTIFELFNLMREIRGAESFAKPCLAFSLREQVSADSGRRLDY